jgi:hypothetical protein
MAASFYIKQNDTAPSIQAVLTDSNGRAKSMVGGASVRFNMSKEDGTNVISGGIGSFIVPLSKGIVAYEWAAGDTADAGIYNAEFEITYTSGQVETFPNNSYIKVIVKEELA